LATKDHATDADRGYTRQSMLDMAAAQGYINTIKVTLARGGDVNATTSDGRTALHCAAFWNQASVVDVLVAYGAFMDAADSRGFTPLHVACARGACEAVVALVQNGANKCKTTEDGLSPMLLAVQNAQLAVATVLVHAAEEEDKDIIDRRHGAEEYSALDVAARFGHQQMLKMIIRHNADVNAKDSDGVTALYLAALNDQACSVDLLVTAGARVGAQSHGRHGRTALHAACAEGSNEAAHALLIHGAQPHERDSGHRTPLHLAAENDQTSTVKLLLSWHSDPTLRSDATEYTYSALDVAAGRGCVGAVRLMCEHVRSSRRRRVEAERGTLGAPVHHAAENDAPNAIAALARHGADVNNVGGKGRTALHTTAFFGFTRATEALLQAGAAVADRCTYFGFNALDFAASMGHVNVIRTLLSHGADADATEPEENTTALHIAAEFDQVGAIFALAAAKVNLNAQDNAGCTPLHRASATGCYGAVVALAREGADLNKVNDEGKPPLHLAAATPCSLPVVWVLLAVGADTTLRGGSGDDETTTADLAALDLAAKAGHVDVIKLLIKAGAPVDAKNRDGKTALIHAVKANKASAVDALLEAGADAEAHLNDESWTSLHSAAEDTYLEVVRVLLKHGASVHAKDADNDNDTPLHVAVRKAGLEGAYEIVEALLRHDADDGARNDNGLTPLCVIGSVVSAAAALPVIDLLQRAPGDRAWRRRGLPILCCARAKKTGLNPAAAKVSPMEQGREKRNEARHLNFNVRDAVEEGVGRTEQQSVKTAGTNGDDFNGVAAWLLGVREEGLFRTVMGFL
ncbi:unnamed protein product, partial [Pylaiella littoralis]